MYMYRCMHIYVCMYVCMYVCIQITVCIKMYIYTSRILSTHTHTHIYMAMHVYILIKACIMLSMYYMCMWYAYFFKEMSVSTISILTYYLSKLTFHTHSTKIFLDQVTKDFILFMISGKCDFTLFYLLEALGNNDYPSSLCPITNFKIVSSLGTSWNQIS